MTCVLCHHSPDPLSLQRGQPTFCSIVMIGKNEKLSGPSAVSALCRFPPMREIRVLCTAEGPTFNCYIMEADHFRHLVASWISLSGAQNLNSLSGTMQWTLPPLSITGIIGVPWSYPMGYRPALWPSHVLARWLQSYEIPRLASVAVIIVIKLSSRFSS